MSKYTTKEAISDLLNEVILLSGKDNAGSIEMCEKIALDTNTELHEEIYIKKCAELDIEPDEDVLMISSMPAEKTTEIGLCPKCKGKLFDREPTEGNDDPVGCECGETYPF